MPFTFQVPVPVLILGGLLLGGCATRPVSSSSSPSASSSNAPLSKVIASPEELERRAEAHAHYATAIIHELNEEPERAADELFQAALKDPSNETLVLDVTRKLLQFKKNEKALELLVKATSRPDASGALFARLGLIYAVLEKPEEAIQANQQAIRK